MGEYADIHLDDMINEWVDDGCPRIETHRMEQKVFTYLVSSVEAETDKAVLVRFRNEKPVNGHTGWSHAFWFPKSQINFSVGREEITVPKWLIDKQFERASQ